MADWASISRTARTHGDYAGRKQAEQDAYFAFFAGTKAGGRVRSVAKFRNTFASLKPMVAARGLRRPLFGVASSK